MDILSNFSENLSELIFYKKITVLQFASDIGVDLSEAYRYLRKECLPNLANIIKIADCYNCSIDFLLGLSSSQTVNEYNKTPPFSQRFKEVLSENKTLRYRLSKETKISINRIDDWYYGKFLPSVENVVILSKFFKCSVDALLGRES